MSTQIKLAGRWVTVAGGHRTWVGTKAARDAALAAGKIPDGTAVMTTDDYTPPAPSQILYKTQTIPATTTNEWYLPLTVSETGTYLVTGNISIIPATPLNYMSVQINGFLVDSVSGVTNVPRSVTVGGTCIVSLSAGDTVSLYAKADSTVTLSPSYGHTAWIEAVKLG